MQSKCTVGQELYKIVSMESSGATISTNASPMNGSEHNRKFCVLAMLTEESIGVLVRRCVQLGTT
eukprot:2472327-Heterocapsa_arctica.AAC.1